MKVFLPLLSVALVSLVSSGATSTFKAALDEEYVTPCSLPDGSHGGPTGHILDRTLGLGPYSTTDTWRSSLVQTMTQSWEEATATHGPEAVFESELSGISLGGHMVPTVVQAWAVRPQPQQGLFVSGTTHFFYVEQPSSLFQVSKGSVDITSVSSDMCVPCLITQPAEVIYGRSGLPQPNHTLRLHATHQDGDPFVLQGTAYPLRRTRHQLWNQLRSLGGASLLPAHVAPSDSFLSLSVWEFLYTYMLPRIALIADTPPSLVEQGVPVGSGPAVTYFFENVANLLSDTWVFTKHTVQGRVISLLKEVDPVTNRMSAIREALLSHRNNTHMVVLATQLKSLQWSSRTAGTFHIVTRVAFPHGSQLLSATLVLKGFHAFEAGKTTKEGRVEWVSSGGVSQTVRSISAIELSDQSLQFVDDEDVSKVTPPRCVGYRAIVMGPSSSAISLTTVWETADGGVAESHVVLKKEDTPTSGGKVFRPHGYEVAASRSCDRSISFAGDVEPFVFPHLSVSSSEDDSCPLTVRLGLQIGGLGSRTTSDGELSSYQYQFDEIVDVSGSWFATIVAFFIGGPSMGFFSTGQFGQVSGSVMMLVAVSLLKFGPRAYLHYRGVDTAKVREQYSNGGITKGAPLPMRANAVPAGVEEKSPPLTKEQREEVLKHQLEIFAQMKAEKKK